MRKCFSVLVILAVFFVSFPVQAQNETHLSSVTVDIWPEYDQPAVLVIYHISLSSNTTFPAILNLRVPAQAEVYAVAVSDAVNGLLNAPYDRTVQGAWATLKITANSKDVQVEYYDVLVINGTARHFVYNWAGDYGVDAFTVTLQQPVGATDLATNPALTQSSIGQDGFTYYQSAPLALAAGRSFILTTDYQKETDTLSTTGLPVQPAQPLTANIPGRETTNNILIILVVIGVTLILVGTGFGLYKWNRCTRRTGNMRTRNSLVQKSSETDDVYCNQCGKRAQPGDVFCRTCGIRLRKDD